MIKQQEEEAAALQADSMPDKVRESAFWAVERHLL